MHFKKSVSFLRSQSNKNERPKPENQSVKVNLHQITLIHFSKNKKGFIDRKREQMLKFPFQNKSTKNRFLFHCHLMW